MNDRAHVPKKPAKREFVRALYNLDGQLIRPMTRALEVPLPERARGVNALDEVPDSTWFTNRIGARYMSPDEVGAGPATVGNPEAHKPWTVISTKPGGTTHGFIIKDTRGRTFLIKYDIPGQPEAETATHVIMGRLLWAFGLNVTEDYVAFVRREELVLADDASIKKPFGRSRPLTRDELDSRLAKVDQRPDGSFRVLASAWLQGDAIGGHAAEGVRRDDPNDRIPHELRRDLRGLYALFAWLDHVDVHGANMIDVYVADPADPARRYVKHYWVDYGIGLGYGARKLYERRSGYEFYVDYPLILRALVSLGADKRPWEDRVPQTRRGVGMYETTLYDPGRWKSSSPAYVPLYVSDRFDNYWASKIIMRFTRDHIEAAVAAGRLSDPHTASWLVDALIARQRATAKYWFERVNPVDRFTVDAQRLCFEDLAIVYAFAPAASTQYQLTFYAHDGERLKRRVIASGASGVSCALLPLASKGDGYTIVRIETRRPRFRATAFAHVANDPATGVPRVVGVWRE